MSDILVKMCIGLGDLLFYSSILDKARDKYKHAIVCPDFSLLSWRHEDYREDYRFFVEQMCNRLFDDDFFIVNNNLDVGRKDPNQICDFYRLNPYLRMYDTQLCIGDGLNISEEYIVITTKVRSFSKANYNKYVKDRFLQCLMKLSCKYKIIIAGEKRIGKCEEYNNDNLLVYSLYDDIINNISSKNIKDITVDELQNAAPQLDKLFNDCVIMKNAKYVINIGSSGAIQLSMCVSNNVINLCDFSEWPNIFKKLVPSEAIKGNLMISDIDGFIQKIESL